VEAGQEGAENPMANLLLADGFEDGTLDAWDGAVRVAPYNAGAGAYAGSWVARGDFVGGESYNSRLVKDTTPLSKIYVRFRIKYEPTWPWGSLNNTKHCRIWKDAAHTGNGHFFTWYQGGGFYDGNRFGDEAGVPDVSGVGFEPSLDTWHLMEYYFDVAPGTSNGEVWWKFNGSVVCEETGMALAQAGNFIRSVYFLGNIGSDNMPGAYYQVDAAEIWDDIPSAAPPAITPRQLRL